MRDSEHIRFEQSGEKAKTLIWDVLAKADGTLLGRVEWFARWRRYAFLANNTLDLVFEWNCLYDLAAFCLYQTKQHNRRRRAK